MHQSLESLRKPLHDIYDNGVGRGLALSLPIWHEGFSLVPGTTLYVYGPPHTGKTQLIFDIIIDACMKYDLNAFISSPEEGDPHEVYQTLIEMVAQKDYVNTYKNQMNKSERLVAETWVNDHFLVCGMENSRGDTYNLEEWYENVEHVEMLTGRVFHITVMDPFDELRIDWGTKRSDLILQDKLIYVRKHAKRTNKYHVIGAHVRDQTRISQKIDGVIRHYYPAADPQDLTHGQEWYRRGMAMLGLWRPPTFLCDENGIPYDKNSTIVTYGKQKPRQVKRQGSTEKRIHLHWSAKRHRYYQVNHGSEIYPPMLNPKDNENGLTEIIQKKENDLIPEEVRLPYKN